MTAEQRAYKTSIHDVPLVQGLKPEEGWIDMQVQFLVDAHTAGAEEIVFGRTVLPPGARHEWHRHPNAEEIQLVVAGHGTVLDGDEELEMGTGDVLWTPKNRWHGFRNTSDSEDVVLIWCWAGAASRDTAGYEVRPEQS